MNTRQISSCIRADPCMRQHCLGCFAKDQLPTSNKLPFGLVANTEGSTKDGEHWIAIWVDADGRGEYFDSYAQPALPSFQTYLDKNAPNGWKNAANKQIQAFLSTVCGQHCIYYLYHKTRGRPFVIADDESVNAFVHRKFALDLDTYDLELVLNQVCKELKIK